MIGKIALIAGVAVAATARERLEAWVSQAGLAEPIGTQSTCKTSSNWTIPVVVHHEGSHIEHDYECTLASPSDLSLWYVEPASSSPVAGDAGRIQDESADSMRTVVHSVPIQEEGDISYKPAWVAAKGLFDPRAATAFGSVHMDLNQPRAAGSPLRWTSVLPPLPIAFDYLTGALIIPTHAVGVGGGSLTPTVARLQLPRNEDGPSRALAFERSTQLTMPDGAVAWTRTPPPGQNIPSRSSMLQQMDPQAMREAEALAGLGGGSAVDLTRLWRASQTAVLPLAGNLTLVAMGLSYPPNLWVMTLGGERSVHPDFVRGLSEAASEQEALAWRVRQPSVQRAIAFEDLRDYTQEASVENGTGVEAGWEALDYLALLEGRRVAGQPGVHPAAARSRCVDLALGLGIGRPAGFGPMVFLAETGASPLLLTSLQYDVDVGWGPGDVWRVDEVCRRERTVLLAARPRTGAEPQGLEESAWQWGAVATIDAPRGFVGMVLDASQSYLWAVDRESRELGALSVPWIRAAAEARLAPDSLLSTHRLFGGTVQRLMWASHTAARVPLTAFGIPVPSRAAGFPGVDFHFTAHSDLLLGMAPALGSPAGVVVTGYATDMTAIRDSDAPVGDSVQTITTGVATLHTQGWNGTAFGWLATAIEGDQARAEAVDNPPTNDSVSLQPVQPMQVRVRRLKDTAIRLRQLNSDSIRVFGAWHALISRAGLGLGFSNRSACGPNFGHYHYAEGALEAPVCSATTVCAGDTEESRGPRAYADRECRECGPHRFGTTPAAVRAHLIETGMELEGLTGDEWLPTSAEVPTLTYDLHQMWVAFGFRLPSDTTSRSQLTPQEEGAQSWMEANYPLRPEAAQLDRVCFPCHDSCLGCDGFSEFNCTACSFPWSLQTKTASERSLDDFTGEVIETQTQVHVCTPGPKIDTWLVGIGIAVPGAIMFLGLTLAGADVDAFVLVAIAYADLATDVLYTFTEEYHSEALFWASFVCLTLVPVLPFILTLRGDPGLVMLIPRGLEEGQHLSLGEEWSDLGTILGWDPFDAAFELMHDAWECLIEPDVLLMPLGVLGDWVEDEDMPLSPANLARIGGEMIEGPDDADCCDLAMYWVALPIIGLPAAIIMLSLSIAAMLLGLLLQVLYMVGLVVLTGVLLVLGFVTVLAVLVAYRLLFALPIGMGLLHGALGNVLELEWWSKATSSFPWLLPFEENDSLGKFLVVLVLQPIYWTLSLVALAVFLGGSIVTLLVVLVVGMLLYATRLLALRPVQRVWIKVWSLDMDAEVLEDTTPAGGAPAPGAATAAVAAGSALLPVAFKQMMVSELVFESLPELLVQALNNQARDAWSLLAVLSFVVTVLVVLDAAYRYVWYLFVRGVLQGKSWEEAWAGLPLFSAAGLLGLADGGADKGDGGNGHEAGGHTRAVGASGGQLNTQKRVQQQHGTGTTAGTGAKKVSPRSTGRTDGGKAAGPVPGFGAGQGERKGDASAACVVSSARATADVSSDDESTIPKSGGAKPADGVGGGAGKEKKPRGSESGSALKRGFLLRGPPSKKQKKREQRAARKQQEKQTRKAERRGQGGKSGGKQATAEVRKGSKGVHWEHVWDAKQGKQLWVQKTAESPPSSGGSNKERAARGQGGSAAVDVAVDDAELGIAAAFRALEAAQEV